MHSYLHLHTRAYLLTLAYTRVAGNACGCLWEMKKIPSVHHGYLFFAPRAFFQENVLPALEKCAGLLQLARKHRVHPSLPENKSPWQTHWIKPLKPLRRLLRPDWLRLSPQTFPCLFRSSRPIHILRCQSRPGTFPSQVPCSNPACIPFPQHCRTPPGASLPPLEPPSPPTSARTR